MNEDKKVYDWANAEEVAKVIAEVRRAALREGLETACKWACYHCESGEPLVIIPEGNEITHMHQSPSGKLGACYANRIRQRMAEEAEAPGQAQGQEREER